MEHFRPPANRKLSEVSFFVTAHLGIKEPLFADARNAQIVLDSLQFFRSRGEISMYCFVIMPDHVHAVIKPHSPATISGIMRRFKTYVAHEIGWGSIWGESFWSEGITDERTYREKASYVHNNPVKAGLVARPQDYRFSSAKEIFDDKPYELIDYAYGPPTSEAARGSRK